MNYQIRNALIASIILVSACSTSRKTMQSLQSDIAKEIAGKKGTFAVAFKDLKTGEEIRINDGVVYHAASTMKTPVLIEVYRQAADGKFALTDSIELKNEFKSIVDGSLYSLDSADDSEKELYRHIGERRTIDSLAYQMIIVSSNFATNLVIQKVGAENVTSFMRKLGANDIQVLRGVEDGKAFQKGLNNIVTAHDLLVIFEKIARGEAVSNAASKAMINILLDQRFNEIIPALLPPNVRVAHKTGSITHVHHDSGIVMLPDGRKYVLVLLSKDWENEKEAIRTMANISSLIYKHVTKN